MIHAAVVYGVNQVQLCYIMYIAIYRAVRVKAGPIYIIIYIYIYNLYYIYVIYTYASYTVNTNQAFYILMQVICMHVHSRTQTLTSASLLLPIRGCTIVVTWRLESGFETSMCMCVASYMQKCFCGMYHVLKGTLAFCLLMARNSSPCCRPHPSSSARSLGWS